MPFLQELKDEVRKFTIEEVERKDMRQLAAILAFSCLCFSCGKRPSDNPTAASDKTSKTGLLVINPQFDMTERFSEGLAAVRIGYDKTGKWGFIDKEGKFVVNPQFDAAGDFSDSVAAVRIGDDKTGKWSFIDKQGKFVVNPQFEGLDRLSEGFAAALHEGKWGFIEKQGRLMLSP